MPSRIVPSLFGALVAAVSGPSDGPAHTHLPAGHPVAFALYPEATLAQQAGSASPALLQAAADGWAWHAVPSFNLFLALVVFLFLIEDRCVPSLRCGLEFGPHVEHDRTREQAGRVRVLTPPAPPPFVRAPRSEQMRTGDRRLGRRAHRRALLVRGRRRPATRPRPGREARPA